MSLTATTLNGAIAADAKQIKFTSATSLAVGMFVQLDNEFLQVIDVSNTPTIVVTRGQLGSVAAAHNTLTPLAYGVSADFQQSNYPPSAVPTGQFARVAYGAAGAITVPKVNTYVELKSGASSAMTLNDPDKDNQAIVVIQAADAKAYTVDNGSTNNTSGSGFNAGGTASDVGTFGGAIGDGLVIAAVAGKWLVITKTNVTLA
jgi:hypothetical protein